VTTRFINVKERFAIASCDGLGCEEWMNISIIKALTKKVHYCNHCKYMMSDEFKKYLNKLEEKGEKEREKFLRILKIRMKKFGLKSCGSDQIDNLIKDI